jgi:hypothetical protein
VIIRINRHQFDGVKPHVVAKALKFHVRALDAAVGDSGLSGDKGGRYSFASPRCPFPVGF